MASLHPRHIQNFSEGGEMEPHWGYAARMVPCTNDALSCEYLDVVYGTHDGSMLYAGIMWVLIASVVFIMTALRFALPSQRSMPVFLPVEANSVPTSSLTRFRSSLGSWRRKFLLPETPLKWAFGRATRMQVLVFGVLVVPLTVWTFIGITYGKWITPIEDSPGLYNIRTGLGPFSNRIGVLAYALTPLSILLASRENVFSILTGIPYQHFNFLHRWLGYVIFAQGAVHTIGWSIIEIRLYQPQPEKMMSLITETYLIWGLVAMVFLTALFLLSLPIAIRLFGYEFFRKAHYVLAMLYIGACWAHWEMLKVFLIPSLAFWFTDRGFRFARTALIHHGSLKDGSMGFAPAEAKMELFPDAEHGDVVKMDFHHATEWKIGQHYYLCFPQGAIWQSHPFTPSSVPTLVAGRVRHEYIFRAKSGETAKIAALARASLAALPSSKTSEPSSSDNEGEKSALTRLAAPSTSVILTGPYGEDLTPTLDSGDNILGVAGGTGITYVLPSLIHAANSLSTSVHPRKLELIWAVRRKADVEWVREGLEELKRTGKRSGLKVHIFVTRESVVSESKLARAEKQASARQLSDSESALSQTQAACDCGPESETSSGVLDITSTAPAAMTAQAAPEAEAEVKDLGEEEVPENRHPDLQRLVGEFVAETAAGATSVVASGPGGMLTDLRSIVAALNVPTKGERGAVRLWGDDRLEW